MTDVKTGIVLPTTKSPAAHTSPKNLIVFSKPKVGKTSLFAQLPDALILDLENGTDFIEAMKLKASNVEEIKAVGEAILAAGKPYKYIVVDTITALEEICTPYAEILYSRTAMGKGWFKRDANGNLTQDSGKAMYGSILNMPMGAGYAYQREAFTKIIEYIKTWAPRVILVGHVKDIVLDKAGADVNAMDLDLIGKQKRITASQSDAIGYLYRKGNQNILTFKTTDEIACGARPDHLRNAEIVVSEMIDNKLVTHWDRVYLD
jgi:hypothetical protein